MRQKKKKEIVCSTTGKNDELRTIDIDDLTISYKISGSGPPLVFFHGWIGHEDTFGLCHEGFGRHFTVYRLAWPGYGGSTPMHGFSIEDFVEVGRKFMEKLGLKDVTLMGNCLGGNVAMEFAERHPEYLSKMILIETHAYFPNYLYPLLTPGLGAFIYWFVFKNMTMFNVLNSFMPLQKKDISDDFPYTWEGFERTRIRSALGFLRAVYKFSKKIGVLYVDNYKVDVPILYVEGGKTFGPVGLFSQKVREHFKNTEIISLPEAEHNPVCEIPEIFNERVLRMMGFNGD
jgi:pimeloyl-ACP methyl ester carboxylesterase